MRKLIITVFIFFGMWNYANAQMDNGSCKVFDGNRWIDCASSPTKDNSNTTEEQQITQFPLPQCPNHRAIRWHLCVGIFEFGGGVKYVGEFREDKRTGQGIIYERNGNVRSSGLWVEGILKQSYPLDIKRFPFVFTPVPATSASTTTADSGQIERERLIAELEAARKRQQELENQLISERINALQVQINKPMGAIESKCQGFGFRPGSDQFANCMQSEFNATENNKRRAECMNEYSSLVARCTLSCAAKPNVYGRYMPGVTAACEADCRTRVGPPNCG